jgi:hypothetical protein
LDFQHFPKFFSISDAMNLNADFSLVGVHKAFLFVWVKI